jgi:hypothetical protein
MESSGEQGNESESSYVKGGKFLGYLSDDYHNLKKKKNIYLMEILSYLIHMLGYRKVFLEGPIKSTKPSN